jgi:hypothetical protein
MITLNTTVYIFKLSIEHNLDTLAPKGSEKMIDKWSLTAKKCKLLIFEKCQFFFLQKLIKLSETIRKRIRGLT